MNYSRRQLEALGEPFGESATRLKVGGRIYGGGGSQPTDTKQTTVTELPEWAKPYAKDILSKGAALTDVNANPYQTYGGARVAGFSPLQTQAMTGAQNMQTAEQGQVGTALSAISGLGGLNVANQATTGGFQNQVGGYMNPYLQYSLAPQLAEANRQYDISGIKQQGAATQAGAFGGSREAIMAAENERNRNMGLQNIVGQGYNQAFNQAQNQYNQNLGTQLQGFGLSNAAAGQLGQLGGQQFQQGMDINKLQSGYGAMQQAQQQQGLDVAYQDFQNQQNYPYRQLGYMSDLLRGTPTGSSGVTNMYAPPANVAGQIAGLGIGAMGLSKFMAEGGMADGGSSVEDPQNIQEIVNKLSDAQLMQSLKAAMQRGDAMQIDAIKQEQAMRASERNGLASTVTPNMADEMMPSAANGGIVAFAEGELVVDPLGNIISGDSTTGKDFSFNEKNRLALEKAERAIQESKKPAVMASEPYNAATATRRSDFEKPSVSKPGPEIFKGLADISKATGVSMDSMVNQWKDLTKSLNAENAEDLKQLDKLANKMSGRSEQIKQEGLGRALAEFGFKWAQSAAKPGARFFGSAAEASPAISASLAKTQELQQAAEDNQQRIEITMQQAKIAQKQGNRQLAAQLTQHLQQLQLEGEKIKQSYGLGMAQIGAINRRTDATIGMYENRSKAAIAAAEAKLMPMFQSDRGAKDLARQLESKYGKNWQQQAEPQREYQNYFNKFKAMAMPSLISASGGAGGIPLSDDL